MAKKTNGRTPYKGNEAQRDGYMNFGNIMGNFFGNKPQLMMTKAGCLRTSWQWTL